MKINTFIYSKNIIIIKYILDKGYDLEDNAIYLFKPIHYICFYKDEEMIKYIINKNVSLNDNNIKLIYYIQVQSDLSHDILYFLIDNGVIYEHLPENFQHIISNYYKIYIKFKFYINLLY